LLLVLTEINKMCAMRYFLFAAVRVSWDERSYSDILHIKQEIRTEVRIFLF